MRAYIFDIDGTLADCEHRVHHLRKQPKDWDAFYANQHADTPIPHMIELLRDMRDVDIIFVTGRGEEHREATDAWLRIALGDGWDWESADDTPYLYMRSLGDRRDDTIVKIELLAQLRADGWEPILVFEDRKRVVDAFRAAGVPVAQVAPGDF